MEQNAGKAKADEEIVERLMQKTADETGHANENNNF